jgi:four helix bundle protein
VAENVIQEKSFQFALDVVDLREKREFVLSRQLLRSGTSIGANVEEAISAQSRKDFVAKMSIATKEARETKYWLRLLRKSKLAAVDVGKELAKADELLRILTSIVMTAKQGPAADAEPDPDTSPDDGAPNS